MLHLFNFLLFPYILEKVAFCLFLCDVKVHNSSYFSSISKLIFIQGYSVQLQKLVSHETLIKIICIIYKVYVQNIQTLLSEYYQAGDTCIPLPRKSLWTPTKNCRLQSWTLYKSADCRWISITILCVSFTNSATVSRLEQVQLCNRRIAQSADNITGLKCAKECLILKCKYRYIQNPWYFRTADFEVQN